MLGWLGIAVLSFSWLLGLSYYHHANFVSWSIATFIGTALLLRLPDRLPAPRPAFVGLLLTLPALLMAPWPYRAAPLGIALGLGLALIPHTPRVMRRIGNASLFAGIVLLAQGLALQAYEAMTARSHELPGLVAKLFGGIGALLGIDTGVAGSTVAVGSMRKVHLFGATWELLFDPTTVCFLIGGIILLVWCHLGKSATSRFAERLTPSILLLCLILAVWLPVRAGLVIAFYLHDILRTEYESPLDSIQLLWSPALHLLALLPLVVLAWRFLPTVSTGVSASTLPPTAIGSRRAEEKRWGATAAWAALSVALITTAILWNPIGGRKPGRVVVEEFHPDPSRIWERTDKPFDTDWYGHLSGYNYYCIYDYLSRFYDTSRLTRRIDDVALADCDVLMIKVPTRPYSEHEVAAIERFVDDGGGLLLIGEHTDVFKSSFYLNPIAERFGFQFRNDCLFGMDAVFEQAYEPPLVPHPVVQHMPPMAFATSCSIVPGPGRAVIRSTGLKNSMADYHADNYYPEPFDHAAMRYGAFDQLWAARHGEGRVLAFTDSTIFSNFATFEPGKAELMLGMIEWLNHRDRFGDPRPWLLVAGLMALVGAGAVGWRVHDAWLPILTAALFGWALAAIGIRAVHAASMPQPPAERPLVQVVIDRTLCDTKLPRNGFIGGKAGEFGIFERWVLRLGYFTARRSGPDIFQSDLVVFLTPNRRPTEAFQVQLRDYVASGGKILVVDSPDNTDSTADALLAPFGLSLAASTPASGSLVTSDVGPTIPITKASIVKGGEAFAHVDGKPVGAVVRHGKGSVVAIGFGHRFTDPEMGVTGDVEPDAELQKVFNVEFALLRAIVDNLLPEARRADGTKRP